VCDDGQIVWRGTQLFRDVSEGSDDEVCCPCIGLRRSRTPSCRISSNRYVRQRDASSPGRKDSQRVQVAYAGLFVILKLRVPWGCVTVSYSECDSTIWPRHSLQRASVTKMKSVALSLQVSSAFVTSTSAIEYVSIRTWYDIWYQV
jgi:hypothetical protein